MYRKILIANRGEIACRIARSVRQLGIAVAGVHSRADAQALHVRSVGESVLIGDGPARASYLDIEAVVGAARRVGADAVHPGFGFLSENPAFARRCAEAGIAFIGPSPEALALFGDKAAAKRLARQLGIPTAGGLDEPSDDVEALLAAVAGLPLPYILKAVAGGGGKGMRVVRERGEARAAIEAAIREGRSSVGDGRLIAERYLSRPRHIEVQILGDGQGGVIHLLDRECTLQRRHQKVIEEAPVSSLPRAQREGLWQHAVALGRASSYLGLGTVEFAVTGEGAVLLEVNPRLQVEHPVTESVTGLDLVALQIRTVFERRLALRQQDVPEARGAAMQARLYAEDAAQGFLPATGTLTAFEPAPEALARTDTGVAAGSEITSHYDPMIAKIIAHGTDRLGALHTLRSALAQTTVLGVTNNRAFLLALLADAEVQANTISTETIDQWLESQGQERTPPTQVAAAMAWWLVRTRAAQAQQNGAGAWHDAALTGWRMRKGTKPAAASPTWTASSGTQEWRVGFGASPTLGTGAGALLVRIDDTDFEVAVEAGAAGLQHGVSVNGTSFSLRATGSPARVDALFGEQQLALDIRPHRASSAAAQAGAQGAVRSPMMGLVIGLSVQPGQAVQAGERLATLESMKMELAITAPVAGTVAWIGCAVQDKVERHQDLFRIAA